MRLRNEVIRGEQLKGHLDLLLLSILRQGSAHGYQIVTALRDGSDGRFDLPEGTVYPGLASPGSNWVADKRVVDARGSPTPHLRDHSSR